MSTSNTDIQFVISLQCGRGPLIFT